MIEWGSTHHQLAAVDVFESGVVFNFVSRRQLAAGGDSKREKTLIEDSYFFGQSKSLVNFQHARAPTF